MYVLNGAGTLMSNCNFIHLRLSVVVSFYKEHSHSINSTISYQLRQWVESSALDFCPEGFGFESHQGRGDFFKTSMPSSLIIHESSYS